MIFSLPAWIKPHLFVGKKMADLTEKEIADLREKISRFKDEAPEVSVMIPAWNEQDNIFRALSCLSSNITRYKVEIVVINNNSTDKMQQLLDSLGVRNYLQPEQGTPHARQLGLEMAKGKYHLCADSDSFYPPHWIDLMVEPMEKDRGIVGVYGRYSYLPPEGSGRFWFWAYEKVTSVLILLRKKNREHINFLGFNMGFVTEVGRTTGGFKVRAVRKFTNAADSEDFTEVAEDGQMAVNLKTKGRLKMVTDKRARVFTSPRRLLYDGGLGKAFWNRLKLHSSRMAEYLTGRYKKGSDI